jgi:hypothetical protein
MESISIYLEKFKDFGLKEQLLKETICEILDKEYSVSVNNKDIELRNGEMIIKVSGVEKSELYINKESIISDIEKELSKDTYKNIR